MEILIKAGQFLLGISILIVVHEMGHFLAARAFGIKVEKFFLFFDVGGVKLFRFKRGDTEYGMGWLPLGGYVKITGMIDESMDKDFMETEPQPYEFRAKPVWQRLIVMLGGIIMNVILGVLIFTMHTWYYGDIHVPLSVLQENGIEARNLGKEVGFRDGDVIVSINGDKLQYADDIRSNAFLTESSVDVEILRNGETKHIVLDQGFAKKLLNSGVDSFVVLRQPFDVKKVQKGSNAEKAGIKDGDRILSMNDTATTYFTPFHLRLGKYKDTTVPLQIARMSGGHWDTMAINAKVDERGLLGFMPGLKTEVIKFSFGESVSTGASKAWHAIYDNVKALGRLVMGDLPPNKSITGLVGIANMYPGTWDWNIFWNFAALLSMVLAFMNLLPIPALDGGHVLFLLVEMVRRKPLSYKFLEVAQMVGMVILFLLMGFAFYNDIAKLVFKN